MVKLPTSNFAGCIGKHNFSQGLPKPIWPAKQPELARAVFRPNWLRQPEGKIMFPIHHQKLEVGNFTIFLKPIFPVMPIYRYNVTRLDLLGD